MSKDLDDLIASLGEPTPVETTGPSEPDEMTDGDQDVDALTPLAFTAKIDDDDDSKVRTARQAIAWGKAQMVAKIDAYKGLCLMFVRLCLGIDPLAPDAITAWDMAKTKRRCTPAEARRGHAGFFRGGKHGHVVLCLGSGRCLTNDTGAPGTINVALIADIERAWGYVFLGDTSDLNGERPAPAPRARKRQTSREWRLAFLRNARARARAAGHTARVDRLTAWIEQVR